MHTHEFLFHPGHWIGEGKIAFSGSPQHLHFYTRWEIEKMDDQTLTCNQQVEMQGSDELVNNRFVVSEISLSTFSVELENELIGKVKGKGVMDARTLAWEFRGKEGLEGFEVYELQDNGDYLMHAEYSSLDQFRTVIDGRIWKKSI